MRSLMMLGAGLAVCALGSVAGAAGEGSLTSQVKEGCKAELESYCKGVTPGEGRLLACLYAFEDKLSARCDYALYDAAMRLERAVATLSRSKGTRSASAAIRRSRTWNSNSQVAT